MVDLIEHMISFKTNNERLIIPDSEHEHLEQEVTWLLDYRRALNAKIEASIRSNYAVRTVKDILNLAKQRKHQDVLEKHVSNSTEHTVQAFKDLKQQADEQKHQSHETISPSPDIDVDQIDSRPK